MPVLLDGLEEEPVPDALLAPAAGQQRGGHLEDLVHRLPAQHTTQVRTADTQLLPLVGPLHVHLAV